MSDLHEGQIAKDIGGRQNKNSGAGLFKGDVYNELYVVEGKSSLDPLFDVSCGNLRMVVREAATRSRMGVLSLAHLLGDPGYAKSLRISQYCYLVRVDRGPKDTQYIDKLRVDLSKKVTPTTYRFRIEDPRTGEWWRLLTPTLARKKLGKRSARLS